MLQNSTVTENMLQSLRETKPWTRFMSVLGFIGVGIMTLVGLVFILGMSFLPQQAGGPPMAIMGIIYILGSVLYFVPSLYLFKYASAIGRLRDGSQEALEDALLYQKSFWKFIGILTLVMLVIVLLGIIAAIALPIFLAVRAV